MAPAVKVNPDFEIVVRDADSNCVLVAGFFIEEDGTTDVAIGWDGVHPLDGLRALFFAAEVSLQGSIAFTDVENIHAENKRQESEGDQLPF